MRLARAGSRLTWQVREERTHARTHGQAARERGTGSKDRDGSVGHSRKEKLLSAQHARQEAEKVWRGPSVAESGAAGRRVGVAPRARHGSAPYGGRHCVHRHQAARQHGHTPQPHVCPTHCGEGLALLTSRRRRFPGRLGRDSSEGRFSTSARPQTFTPRPRQRWRRGSDPFDVDSTSTPLPHCAVRSAHSQLGYPNDGLG